MSEPVPHGRHTVRLAIAFYSAFALVAFLWGLLDGRRNILFVGPEPPSSPEIFRWTLVGVLFGLSIVLVSQLLLARFAWAEELAAWFKDVIGSVTWTEAFVLALLSAIGEELLFRGAIQPTIGLLPTALLFALVHMPPRRRLLFWTLSSGLLGLVFGYAAELSGHLGGPIAAHFVINFFNLKLVTVEKDEP